MDLYIRSQNKRRLEKIGKLFIDCEDFEEKTNSKYHIYNDDSYESSFMGEFKTEKRALEVLDEIQNILKPKFILNASSIKQNGDYYEKNGEIYQDYSADARIEQLNIYVYEIPKE